MTRPRRLLAVVCAAALVATVAPAAATAQPAPNPAVSWWQPGPDVTWQVQLSGKIDTTVDADAYDIDLVETPQAVIDRLHADGRKAVCYLSAGSWERWRPDAKDFPKAVLGRKLDGWPGERWLDIRRLDVLGPIMEARLDLCVAKGFDAADFDNVDGYQNRSGFQLTAADQLAYNRFLADAAHARGLAAALKNDLGQIEELEPSFDFAVNEECVDYRECDLLQPFTAAGKAIVMIQYKDRMPELCKQATALHGYGMRKKLNLNAWIQTC